MIDFSKIDLDSPEMDEGFDLYWEIFHEKGWISKEAYRLKQKMNIKDKSEIEPKTKTNEEDKNTPFIDELFDD